MSQPYINSQPTLSAPSKYQIIKLVGQGKWGRVFSAIHQPTGNLVALKELDQRRCSTHKFLQEFSFLLSLQHPNIVACQGLEHSQTGRYLVMDYCQGGNLRDLMQSNVKLSLGQSLNLTAEILAGLEHIHSCGIVHCDIKPDNILLNLETRGCIARISDFGIARRIQLGSTAPGNVGSPLYMAPERFYGHCSPRSDIYAVGVLLFELVVGNRPFSGLYGELMSAHLNQPVTIPDTVPFSLRSTISTALQKLPARRFASAAEMLKSVKLALEIDQTRR